MNSYKTPDERQLLEEVKSAREHGGTVSATLTTDERVFARITDGIYREPASALRELIANAYDADATEVRIITDAPRFSRIVVRDNGHGLTEEALVHVICHIGGSLKRTAKGSDEKFNVTKATDRNLSPGGRRLIGKLGIGLFSVSQLTHHLVIVTKVKGQPVRRVCDILLVPQTDLEKPDSSDGSDLYVTGKALIRTIPAEDIDSQGTEITLLDIRPFVRESLQSQAIWSAIEREPGDEDEQEFDDATEIKLSSTQANVDIPTSDLDEFYERPAMPTYHIGRVSKRNSEELVTPPVLPWDPNDSSCAKFTKLVDGIQKLASETTERIRLNEVLDTYLRTIWTLSLSMPLPYVKSSPFSLTKSDNIPIFAISNKGHRSKAIEIELAEGESVQGKLGLTGDQLNDHTKFSVLVDDIELRRPLEFSRGSEINRAISPLMFVGKMKSDLTTVSDEYSGGPIEFEAYFYWQPKVVPADHNGIMVRINGASGILFDDQFLRYQISELTRLRQITAEIYVKRGLDAALNIDRESFNIAHTHYQVLKKWVHHALRQLMSAQKRVSGTATATRLAGGLSAAVNTLSEIVNEGRDTNSTVKSITFTDAPIERALTEGLVFDRSAVFSPRSDKRPSTRSDKLKEELLERQIIAVASVLQDYGVFDGLEDSEKDTLLRKIVAIFSVDIRK
jgi:hypothetical protein